MKSICLFLIAIFSINYSYSQQNWPPTGAVWHYEVYELGFGPLLGYNYMTITVSGDTIINGKQCKKLDKNRFLGNCTDDNSTSYIYSDSNIVYWYNDILDTFTTLYDFTAQVNDTWDILVDSCSYTITVDSVSNKIINQDTLKVLFISENLYGMWDGVIIEGIGHSNYFLPTEYMWPCCGSCSCHESYINGLRCYQDSKIGAYVSGINPCDTVIWLSINEMFKNKNELNVYPNPTQNLLYIESSSQNLQIKQIKIIGLNGRNVIHTKQSPINTSEFSQGVYLYQVEMSNGELVRGKFVKE